MSLCPRARTRPHAKQNAAVKVGCATKSGRARPVLDGPGKTSAKVLPRPVDGRVQPLRGAKKLAAK